MLATHHLARGAAGIALGALAIVCPTTARAHPLVDEGHRLYEEAEFVAALDALGRADAATDLDMDDLVRLLETRALVQLAMGHEDGMRADLRRLAAIAPDHTIARTAPPDVQRAFAQIRAESAGTLRVLATTETAAAGVTVTVRVENDWASLVREIRTSGRAQGGTSWSHATDAPLLVASASGGVVEYYAEAIGPGGVVIARSGSESAPLQAASAGAAAGGGDEVWPWILVGAAVVLVAGGVITAVLVTTQSGGPITTQVEPFTVRF